MEQDPHPWRSPVLLGLVTTVATLVCWFVIDPHFYRGPLAVDGRPVWQAPEDVWKLMVASHWVVSGDIFKLFEVGFGKLCVTQEFARTHYSPPQYLAGPLLPILLAPLAAIGEHFHLVELGAMLPAPLIPRPSMWPPYAAYATLISAIPFTYAVRSLAVELGVRAKLVRIQIVAVLMGFIPMVYIVGHFEDALACAFVLLSCRDLGRKRWIRSAVMLGIAILFKQWAWLAVPLFAVVTPKERRLRFLVPSVLVPGAYFALTLAIDWCAASHALFNAETSPQLGHRAVWVSSQALSATAGPYRALLFVAVLAVAWMMRGRSDLLGVTAALGVTLIARFAFEPVLFVYYIAPGVVTLFLFEMARSHRVWEWRLVPLVAVWYCIFIGWRSAAPVWWAVSGAMLVVVIWPAVGAILHAPEGTASEVAREQNDAPGGVPG